MGISVNGRELTQEQIMQCYDKHGNFRLEVSEAGLKQFEPKNPVTDVERAAAALAARRRTREDVIFSDTSGLVATCYAWLQRACSVPGGGTDTW